ncbi:MAG: cysteine synthase B [Gammaproteobacteria bacterium TMED119]|mgnify:CR=1 FL=1|nr:MAG: cysteine synthase B [Gammaproteobacteria bacterium TMED119]OUV63469.1 MAG: cysteine synthase B [Gammaproteobacteria bacterium TMED119]RCL46301.1 MAG: cysteine synthase CysM [Candidatus Thioglobus sp.]|tara:strand:+ start:778 stop:1671 length:894 start_codon:yes stop_codon:yes gene_type:complete
MTKQYKTMADCVGNTPLVKLQYMNPNPSNTILLKLEGNNPAGSVKDRPALNMIKAAQARGDIKPGDTLIEPTSGNTGIALAMAAAVQGYKMILVMPETMTVERRSAMTAYGAELVLVSGEQGMEGARDVALQMQADGKGKVLDQFANPDNIAAHYETTGPEVWAQTGGEITHFMCSLGTTGTIMGVSKYLRQKKPDIQMIGIYPAEGSQIPGIRKWAKEYEPVIFDHSVADQLLYVSRADADHMAVRLGREEGIFAGISSGATLFEALKLSEHVSNATIVVIICDRGDRYISTGIYG